VILTNSSVAAKVHANLAHYAAAKWGVSGLMRALAVELAADDIRVNSVQPTAVNTDLIHNAETYALFRPDLTDPSREDVVESFRGLHLLNVEWLKPADVSNAVAFLASDQARYITGLAMSVDAGAALR
jgi:NAD(P)-dependent dehydrogenase (short-subunit alcohol dehydrogenase family)